MKFHEIRQLPNMHDLDRYVKGETTPAQLFGDIPTTTSDLEAMFTGELPQATVTYRPDGELLTIRDVIGKRALSDTLVDTSKSTELVSAGVLSNAINSTADKRTSGPSSAHIIPSETAARLLNSSFFEELRDSSNPTDQTYTPLTVTSTGMGTLTVADDPSEFDGMFQFLTQEDPLQNTLEHRAPEQRTPKKGWLARLARKDRVAELEIVKPRRRRLATTVGAVALTVALAFGASGSSTATSNNETSAINSITAEAIADTTQNKVESSVEKIDDSTMALMLTPEFATLCDWIEANPGEDFNTAYQAAFGNS